MWVNQGESKSAFNDSNDLVIHMLPSISCCIAGNLKNMKSMSTVLCLRPKSGELWTWWLGGKALHWVSDAKTLCNSNFFFRVSSLQVNPWSDWGELQRIATKRTSRQNAPTYKTWFPPRSPSPNRWDVAPKPQNVCKMQKLKESHRFISTFPANAPHGEKTLLPPRMTSRAPETLATPV